MKRLLVLLPLLAAGTLFAQNPNEVNRTDVENALKVKTAEVMPDSAKVWKTSGTFGVNFTNTSLYNWQGGGQDAFTVTGLFNGFANYRKGKNQWSNLLEMGYGITRLGGNGAPVKIRKSEDRFVFTSKYTRAVTKRVGFAGLVDFRTQFDLGFKYDVAGKSADGLRDSLRDEKISNLLSPGFLVASAGIEVKEGDMFYALISPVTSKVTIVNDRSLSEAGAFGVGKGDWIRSEFGAYINSAFKYKIMENIAYQTNLNLFMNYKTPGLIDIFWDNTLNMTVNKMIQATFSTNLIYDDDIKIPRRDGTPGGPRIQFKHVLAVGLTFKLK